MKQLDEMTPEEIRIEIAERRGWVKVDFDDNRWVLKKGDEWRWESEFKETEDIAAAWELVSELNEAGFLVIVKSWQTGHSKYVSDADCGIYLVNALDENFTVTATTAPLAICRAWLAWKRSEE